MTHTLTAESIPEQVTSLPQWVCWREDDRDGKPTKLPIKPYRTSGTPLASATDPDTWREFETALAYHRESSARTDGVGFVFDPEAGIVGVDLDDCRDAENEELAPWASEIVERLDSYTEVSPSGTGIHVLVDGELPAGRNRRGDVEIYDRDRFFTVTGAHVSGTPTEVVRRQDALLAVHHEFVQTGSDESSTQTNLPSQEASHSTQTVNDESPTPPVGPNSGLHRKFGQETPAVDDPALEAALHGLSPREIPDPVPRRIDEVSGPGVTLPDAEVLTRATNSKNGETIQALLDGDPSLWNGRESRYPSQSEADMGLCFYLGFWTGGDPSRMDRLFRESGLYREKWDRRHYGNGATYGAVCVARTLLKLDDYYSPPETESEPEGRDDHSPTTEPAGGRPDLSTDAHREDASRSPDGSTDRTASPHDMSAVDDAKRLATEVKRQQKQLEAYEQQIVELETQLRWYKMLLDLQSDGPSHPEEDELFVNDPPLYDVGPREEPAGSPEEGFDDREQGPADRDVDKIEHPLPEPVETDDKTEKSSSGDDGESRLKRLFRHWRS